MPVLLGIDTGGTYTDAVLLDEERGVIAAAKALTTKYDLSVGIQHAVEMILPHPHPDIQLVSLSTTLATNAIVEGKGSPICLLLIGYDPCTVAETGLERLIASERIVFIQGGHTVTGEEQAPLDIDTAREAILTHARSVAAFAISGYFGVRNPAHELRIKRLVRRLTGLPVTCGHELTTHLDAPRRALTVALNARLTPLLHQLILTVREVLTSQGINAPLMVVKGDGSLIEANMALERPVETILSGPAASVIGARYLSNAGDCFVIDIGGTTTDIAALHNGYPILNHKGAQVGGWRTMVEALDVRTTGLGGDSEVHVDDTGNLSVGPRRVIPLSLLATYHPSVKNVLRSQMAGRLDRNVGRFVMLEQPPGFGCTNLASDHQQICELLGNEPVPISQILYSTKGSAVLRYHLNDLIERGVIATSAFTPTDAVHVLGQYCSGSVEAATLGSELWSRWLGTSREEFCKRVVRQVIIQAGCALMDSVFAEESDLVLSNREDVGRRLIERALGADAGGIFTVALSLRRSIIGIGAPAATYLSPLAEKLNAKLFIPEHAEVANAIGAVAGGVVQTISLLIRPMDGGNAYRVHLPFGVRDFQQLADAIAYAKAAACRLAHHRARQAGASVIQVRCEQHDRTAQVGSGDVIYIETEVTATAVGRPRLKDGTTIVPKLGKTDIN